MTVRRHFTIMDTTQGFEPYKPHIAERVSEGDTASAEVDGLPAGFAFVCGRWVRVVRWSEVWATRVLEEADERVPVYPLSEAQDG